MADIGSGPSFDALGASSGRAAGEGPRVGVLGAGQLGAMLAQAARSLGASIHTFAPEADAPAERWAQSHTQAGYEDEAALKRFAAGVDVVTLEFENIPVQALRAIAEAQTPVLPPERALFIAQHRLREKTFLAENGFPVAPFTPVAAPEALPAAFEALGGVPCLLKTAAFGYDGKGQQPIDDAAQAARVAQTLQTQARPADGWVLEQRVNFLAEASLVLARGRQGEIAHVGLIENRHRDGILDVSAWPAAALADCQPEAARLATALAEALDYTGVLCVEFFIPPDRRPIINEIAPRVHNSGHLTREAFDLSQFHLQIQVVCGLPLAPPTARAGAAAMANLLGDLWFAGGGDVPQEPDWQALTDFPDVTLTLYGKAQARRGRKMGHLVATGDDPGACRERVQAARAATLRYAASSSVATPS